MNKKSQSLTEYVVVIACVIASLVVMQAYFRRGLSGKIKSSTDQNLGPQFDPSAGNYTHMSSYKEDSVQVSDLTEKDSDEDGVNETYSVSYSVTGPQGHPNCTDISADSGRDPLEISDYTKYEVNWEDLD